MGPGNMGRPTPAIARMEGRQGENMVPVAREVHRHSS